MRSGHRTHASQPNIVVGSGPTGIACAKTLLDAGEHVLLLDGGETLELGTTFEPGAAARAGTVAGVKGVKLKLAYGSDYPYRGAEETIGRAGAVGQITPSLAVGGFSSVWGAAVLPYTADDISSWPFSIEQLSEGYSFALSMMTVAGAVDGLAKTFPLYTAKLSPLSMSPQAQSILLVLGKHEESLAAHGFSFGRSRLAMRPEVGGEIDCVYCAQCMYGCPHQLIYSSTQTLESLRREYPTRLHYKPGHFVKAVRELPASVRVNTANRRDESEVCFEGERVYLGAGCLSTTRIVLESLRAWDAEVPLQVSEYFLLPLLGAAHEGELNDPKLHTLSQLFLECTDLRLSSHRIHTQIYTYNDLYLNALSRMAGPFVRLFRPLVRRLHVAQGYLHSSESSRIHLKLVPGDGHARLEMRGEVNQDARRIIKAFSKRLWSLRRETSLTPLLPLLSIGMPGEGRHAGGSFPMSKAPRPFESDLLGRPFGMARTHLIDSSCLPSIPAPTITLTAMANAHRVTAAVLRQTRGQTHVESKESNSS